jgi:hypothetical protein
MRWEWRKDRLGKQYRSFLYYDAKLKKNVRLRKTEIPSDIVTDEQANAFCSLKSAEHETARLRIQRKLEWRTKFYDFNELMGIFTVEIKKMAPNSWENNIYFLEQYALPFFLQNKQCNNLNNWHIYYDEFRDWLETARTVKGDRPLAYSTKNHVISALNTFMVIMKCRISS